MIRLFYLYYKTKYKIQKLRRMLQFPRGQMVLDIGGGDGPFARADIVCEKYISDDSERDHPFLFDRPLVIADIEYLPFKSGAFDYIFCSHVLEHVKNPDHAIGEITRVGRKGYVEVPSEYLELTANSKPSHLWTVRSDDNETLVFREKLAPQFHPYVDQVYHETLWNRDMTYMLFHYKNLYKLFAIARNWTTAIPHRIERATVAPASDGYTKCQLEDLETLKRVLQPAASGSILNPRSWIKKAIRKFFCRKDLSSWYEQNLACPFCKNAFNQIPVNRLTCDHCNKTYPVINGVPILLREFSNDLTPAGAPSLAH